MPSSVESTLLRQARSKGGLQGTRKFLHRLDHNTTRSKTPQESFGFVSSREAVKVYARQGNPADVAEATLAMNLSEHEASKLLATAFGSQIKELLSVLPYNPQHRHEIFKRIKDIVPDYVYAQILRVETLFSREKKEFRGEVRRLRKEDLDNDGGGYLRVLLESWVKDPATGKINQNEVERYLARMRQSLDAKNPYNYFVAEARGGQLVGVIGYTRQPSEYLRKYIHDDRTFELVNFYADPFWKGTGVGKKLIERAEFGIKIDGGRNIILASSPRFAKTWPIYTGKFGYRERGVLDQEYNNQSGTKVFEKSLVPVQTNASPLPAHFIDRVTTEALRRVAELFTSKEFMVVNTVDAKNRITPMVAPDYERRMKRNR